MDLIRWYSGIVCTSISQGLGFESRDRLSNFICNIFFLICYVIELYRIEFKRLLDIQSAYRFKFNFVLNLNKTGVGKEYLMTAYWWM